MKTTLLLTAALATTLMVSCASRGPSANTGRVDRGVRVFGTPENWGSGGHYTGFSASRPSANGYNVSASGAPC